MSISRRERRPELMDSPDADPRELARSLSDLRAANRWLAGTRTILRLLEPILGEVRESPARIVDVATGSADIPVALSTRAVRGGRPLEVTAVDIHRGTLEAARRHTSGRPDVHLVGGDARRLPFGDGAFHVALCSTALHHLSDDDAVEALREMRRVSSRGLVVLDLRRSRGGLAAVQLLAATAWRGHPITRHDGPVSVRAAFTTHELRRLAARAGLEGAKVTTEPLFRQALVYRHPVASGPIAAGRAASGG